MPIVVQPIVPVDTIPSGGYISAEELYDDFGKTNVDLWADRNGNGSSTEIANTIQVSIVNVSGFVDEVLAGGPYVIPLVGESKVLKSIVRGLVAGELYAQRGLLDEDNKLRVRVKSANDTLQMVKTGEISLPCEREPEVCESPEVYGG